jgi:hypothetical protein
MAEKPTMKTSLEGNKELEKVEEQFKEFEKDVEEMTFDRMNLVPKLEMEPQTKLAQSEIANMQDIYLKPIQSIASKEPFNEKYRSSYEYDKQYVHIIAENNEIKGDTIEMWTKPYPGMPAQFWQVPVNKPIHVPRFLAEQIKRKFYHRLEMREQSVTGGDFAGQYYGKMVVDTTVLRLDARQAMNKKQLMFMGARNF